jgi:hypothetical protein
VLEGLYKLIKLQRSRESVKNQGTLSTDEVREYFAKKQQRARYEDTGVAVPME